MRPSRRARSGRRRRARRRVRAAAAAPPCPPRRAERARCRTPSRRPPRGTAGRLQDGSRAGPPIDAIVRHYIADARPFPWTTTADSILATLQRLLGTATGTAH
jgi:hypothetical protein